MPPFAEIYEEFHPRILRYLARLVGEKRPAPDEDLIRREMNERIRECIERLPPDYRTVMVLGEIEGFSNGEIADILGISHDNVKVRLHRARASLRRRLAAGCSFSRDGRNELGCDRRRE